MERAAAGSPEGGIVRVYLREVDPVSFRQIGAQGEKAIWITYAGVLVVVEVVRLGAPGEFGV